MTRKELWDRLIKAEPSLAKYTPYPAPDDSICRDRIRCEIGANSKFSHYVKSAVQHLEDSYINTWLGNLLKGGDGEVAEAYAYGIFSEKGFLFDAPFEVKSSHLYRSESNGFTLLDGIMEHSGVWFDIKSLPRPGGIIEKLLNELNNQLRDQGMIATLDGPKDYDGKLLTSKTYSIIRERVLKEPQIGGCIKVPEISSSIQIHSIRDGCYFSTFEFDTYKFAQDNRYQILSDAHQISRNNPFALIFVYTSINHEVAVFTKDTPIYERALARRVFIELQKDDRKVNLYCKSADPNVSIAEIASSIGAIICVNASYDLPEPSISIFLNPNARPAHRITKHHIDQFMNYGVQPLILVDDFMYDNY
jgi:hypothetical protein